MHQMHLCIKKDTFLTNTTFLTILPKILIQFKKALKKKTNFAGNDIRAGRVLDILKT